MAPSTGRISFKFAGIASIAFLAAAMQYNCAQAQVTGAFSPGVYNEPSYGPLPIRRELAEPTAPSVMERANQLQSDIDASRRPYIGNVFTYTDESLVDPNNHLRTVTEGVEGGFFLNDQTQVVVDYLPTIFGPSHPTLFGQEFRATLRGQPTNRLRYFTKLGLFHTYHDVQTGLAVIGGAGASYAINDRVSVNADYNRYIIGNSRLSATGLNLPASQVLVGRVKADEFDFGATIRPTPRTIMDFQYSIGMYSGHRVETNPFNQFSFRVARNVIAREKSSHLQYLQPSYQFLALGFQRDQSGFGNTSLIPTDTTTAQAVALASALKQVNLPGAVGPGVGGYFSPQQFYLSNFRMDAGGRLVGHLFYDIGGGLATQNFRTQTSKLDHGSLVATANASLITKVGRHVTIETGWYFLQAVNTYRRYVLFNQAKYYF